MHSESGASPVPWKAVLTEPADYEGKDCWTDGLEAWRVMDTIILNVKRYSRSLTWSVGSHCAGWMDLAANLLNVCSWSNSFYIKLAFFIRPHRTRYRLVGLQHLVIRPIVGSLSICTNVLYFFWTYFGYKNGFCFPVTVITGTAFS